MLRSFGSYLSIFWQDSFFHTLSELSQNSNAQADCHLLLHPHKISLVSELVPFPRLGPRKTRTCSWVIGRKIPSASCNHTVSPPKALKHRLSHVKPFQKENISQYIYLLWRINNVSYLFFPKILFLLHRTMLITNSVQRVELKTRNLWSSLWVE